MTRGQGIQIGAFHFPIIRLLIGFGLIRVLVRRERLAGPLGSLDWLMLIWSCCALVSSPFHAEPFGALVFRLGLVYNTCGVYFLVRIFCQSFDEIVVLSRVAAILLVPVAVEMVNEKVTFHNVFSELGGIPETPLIREGTLRAQGPFAHPILAGTVGAVCLPLVAGLWQPHRKEAVIGCAACLVIVFASGSSGPVMSALLAVGALSMWRFHKRTRLLCWLGGIGYIVLDLVMKAPAYYLISRIDVTGGSTGYHRARLIESAFQHLHEWWLGGTDFTRHWMPTGVSWNQDHTDITNHYIQMGVIGGLPLMLLFIAILSKGFSQVGQTLREGSDLPNKSRFVIWTLGASLFAHAATCISVSYFDQSFLFLYLTLAAIASARYTCINSVRTL